MLQEHPAGYSAGGSVLAAGSVLVRGFVGISRTESRKQNYIAVWRSDSGNDTCLLPISHLRGKDASVKCLYPQNAAYRCAWHKESGELAVELPVNISARLFEVSANE